MEKKSKAEFWESDIRDLNKLSIDSANLILDQAKILLDETHDTAKSISSKAERIFTFLIPIATALVIYLFQNKFSNTFTSISATLGLGVIGISLMFSYRNFEKYDVEVSGEYPSVILTSKYIDTDFEERIKHLGLIVSLCTNFQNRINKNELANRRRIKNNTKL